MHHYWFSILIILPCAIQVVDTFGGASIVINLQVYSNNFATTANGACCDGVCMGNCDHKFKLCLHPYSDPIDKDVNNCDIWETSFGPYREQNINIFPEEDSLFNIYVEQIWPGNVVFKVYVLDMDIQLHDWVDTLYSVLNETQPSIWGDPKFFSRTIYGIRSRFPTNLQFEYAVVCDRNFTGSYCNISCNRFSGECQSGSLTTTNLSPSATTTTTTTSTSTTSPTSTTTTTTSPTPSSTPTKTTKTPTLTKSPSTKSSTESYPTTTDPCCDGSGGKVMVMPIVAGVCVSVVIIGVIIILLVYFIKKSKRNDTTESNASGETYDSFETIPENTYENDISDEIWDQAEGVSYQNEGQRNDGDDGYLTSVNVKRPVDGNNIPHDPDQTVPKEIYGKVPKRQGNEYSQNPKNTQNINRRESDSMEQTIPKSRYSTKHKINKNVYVKEPITEGNSESNV